MRERKREIGREREGCNRRRGVHRFPKQHVAREKSDRGCVSRFLQCCVRQCEKDSSVNNVNLSGRKDVEFEDLIRFEI